MTGDAAILICITVLIILCAGKPDLLDAIVNRINHCEDVK